jgi:hypothetical protein
MSKLFKTLSLLAVLVFLATACIPAVIGVAQAAPADVINYQAVLGKSVGDQEVADFIATNHCTRVEQLRNCKGIGMVLGINANQTVETIFLYLEDTDGFTAYQGELPFGLRINDTREAVEAKLKEQRVGTGVANEEGLFDRTHFWATYYSAGMTIIYNSPSTDDRNAIMHAIIVEK